MFRSGKPLLTVILSAVLGLLSWSGCRQKAKPVTVRIFRDLASPYGHELDHRMMEFQQTHPHVGGAAIVLQSYDTPRYQDFLQNHIGKDSIPELVILNSRKDAAANPAVESELGNAVNICAAVRACPEDIPAYVPASLTGSEAEAGRQFLAFLQKQPG
jgi:hypothetical protein